MAEISKINENSNLTPCLIFQDVDFEVKNLRDFSSQIFL